MFNKLKLGQKLLIAFLCVGVIPFAVVGLTSLIKASSALEASAFNQLKAVQAIKKTQIEQYFAERQGDMTVLTETVQGFLKQAGTMDAVKASLATEGKDFFADYCKQYGYYDLFLINPDGQVHYTVAKEADYNTNLVNGKFADSNLGKLVRQVIQTRQFGLADFAPYAPSNGEPCGFIAAPIIEQGEVRQIVALQLSLETINKIMQQREGMGKSGETYLVGPNKRMRSDSFLDPTHHSVKASFADSAKGSVDTEASRAALAGSTDA
ncbi:MAG: cache domain-containing protein, partial [Desulfobulbaceae bacterium]|nr:cache domain-containing protein [Desulfobulbaceae bacterium]